VAATSAMTTNDATEAPRATRGAVLSPPVRGRCIGRGYLAAGASAAYSPGPVSRTSPCVVRTKTCQL
jgi:hypothetical protein